MMTAIKPGVVLLCAAAVLLPAAGCFSRKFPEKALYFVEVQRPGEVAGEGDGVLRLARVQVAPMFERKGFVYRTGGGRYEEDFYNEFFAPPAAMIQRATRDWLARSAIFLAVLDPADRAVADWYLQTRVIDLYGDARDVSALTAELAIEYTLVRREKLGADVVFRKQYAESERLAVESNEELVRGWERALARILETLEADVRARLSPTS